MSNQKKILDRIRKDKKLQSAHRITAEELDFLDKVEMFGSLKSVDDILLILRNIRSDDGQSASS